MWRPALVRAALVGVSILAALGLAELAARLLLPAPPVVKVEPGPPPDPNLAEQRQSVALHPERAGLYRETPSGRRLRPNTHVTIENHGLSRRTIELRTNSLGYRNPELRPKRAPRILFLGDSITFGDYLHEDETFVRRVEREAAEHGEAWETVNAGIGGIGLANELAILVETGLSIDPDVVVVGFYLNDFEQSPGVYPSRLPASLRASRLLKLLVARLAPAAPVDALPRETLRGWRDELERDWPAREGDFRTDPQAFNAMIQASARDWGGAWTGAAWERVEPLFEELRRLSRKHGFRLATVVFPVRQQVEAGYLYDHPQRQIDALARRLEIPLLDLLPVLRAEWARGHEQLFYDQCHHTPRGNRIIARSIEGFLRASFVELLAQGS